MPLIPAIEDPYGRNRIWFRMPRWIPDSLASLHGLDQGIVNLPVTIDWGPGHEHLDLSEVADIRRIYSSLIANANDAMQEKLINKQLLI